MGRSFFRSSAEVCDLVIITISFVVDVVFSDGLPGQNGGETAVVPIVLLLWRIARVVDGVRRTPNISCTFVSVNFCYF